MAFVAQPQRNTGDLISDDDWNDALRFNPNFLKGVDGPVDIEANIIPNVDTFGVPFAAPAGNNLGLGGSNATAKRWQDVFAARLHGNRYRADMQRRTVRLKWESLDIGSSAAFTDHQMIKTVTANAVVEEAGLGQILLGVDRSVAAPKSARLDQRLAGIAPSGSALDNRWVGQANPYFKIEFSFTPTSNSETLFFGLRDTPTSANVPLAGEEHMGFQFSLGIWSAIIGDTNSKDLITFTSEVAPNTRQIFEAAILSPTVADFYINGVFGGSFNASDIPTGFMQLSFLVANLILDAGRIDVTVGETVIQEDAP